MNDIHISTDNVLYTDCEICGKPVAYFAGKRKPHAHKGTCEMKYKSTLANKAIKKYNRIKQKRKGQ